jgi:hypothetical protein
MMMRSCCLYFTRINTRPGDAVGIQFGVELVQFWMRFKGRRVRGWPSELTIRIYSESGKKWVTSAEGREPYWWEQSREQYSLQKNGVFEILIRKKEQQ